MKVMSIIGTRPEIIRLSQIFPKLDNSIDHILVHTGQNYHPKLSDIFFSELGLRKPDYYLKASQPGKPFGAQIGDILKKIERLIVDKKPNLVLILGDVNSGLSAIVAERYRVPVVHMEAGNRCYDINVPEEINRRVIDHVVSWNLPYTKKSKDNLLREGIPNKSIFICGNPINEVILANWDDISGSEILKELDIERKQYIIATSHRQENVDNKSRLKKIVRGFELIVSEFSFPIIWSVHPRTQEKLKQFNISINPEKIIICEPFSFFDFLNLEMNAVLAITDSGTVQEECCLLRTPTVTIRDTTERPETVECGSNFISGVEPIMMVKGVELMLKTPLNWNLPDGYEDTNVSDKVVCFIVSLLRD